MGKSNQGKKTKARRKVEQSVRRRALLNAAKPKMEQDELQHDIVSVSKVVGIRAGEPSERV